MDEKAFYLRIKALCCAHWHITPHAFDRDVEAGRVAIEDVLEAVILYAQGSLGFDLQGYFFREEKAKAQAKLVGIKALTEQFRAETDPVKREEIRELIRKLNHGEEDGSRP